MSPLGVSKETTATGETSRFRLAGLAVEFILSARSTAGRFSPHPDLPAVLFLADDGAGDIDLLFGDVHLQDGDGQLSDQSQRLESGELGLVGMVHPALIKLGRLERRINCLRVENVGVMNLQPTREYTFHK